MTKTKINRPQCSFSGIFIGVFLILTAGCASTPPENVILQDNYNSVRLEAVKAGDELTPIVFDHPFEIGVEDMQRLLASVQVVIPPGFISRVILKNKPVPAPAFTEEEVEKFAPIFVKAFSMAGPEERVVFFLHHQRVIYKGTVSSGVAFFKDGRFNLIFGRYLRGNEPGKQDINVKGNPFPSSHEQSFYLHADNFQKLVTDERFPATGETLYPKRWLAIEHASLLSAEVPESRQVSLEELSSSGPDAERSTPPAPEADLSLEEKLRTLKRLQEEGLITEDEYSRKREELLSSF